MSAQSVIGPVPAHWDVWPFFATGKIVQSKNIGMREDNLLSLSYGRIVEKDIESSDGLLPESFETYQIVQPNDMVFRFTDLQNDQRSLRSALVRDKGIITSAYLAFRPNELVIVPKFLDYLMRAYDLSKVFYPLGGGVRQSLKFDDVKRLGIIVPPVDEQKAIADFLNRELAEIDVLIDRQASLLQLIDERYNSKLIETFSNKPGWVKDKMSRLVDTFKGPRAQLLSSTYLATTSGDFPVYSGSTEGDGIVGWLSDFDFDLGSTGGLLISTVGSEKVMTIRRVFGRISLSQNCMLVVPRKIEIEFLQFALEASLNQVRGNFMGHMQASFRVSDLRQMWLMFPNSVSEQLRVAEEFKLHNQKLAKAVDVVNAALLKFAERRQSLISAAVTGKIDVRKVP